MGLSRVWQCCLSRNGTPEWMRHHRSGDTRSMRRDRGLESYPLTRHREILFSGKGGHSEPTSQDLPFKRSPVIEAFAQPLGDWAPLGGGLGAWSPCSTPSLWRRLQGPALLAGPFFVPPPSPFPSPWWRALRATCLCWPFSHPPLLGGSLRTENKHSPSSSPSPSLLFCCTLG